VRLPSECQRISRELLDNKYLVDFDLGLLLCAYLRLALHLIYNRGRRIIYRSGIVRIIRICPNFALNIEQLHIRGEIGRPSPWLSQAYLKETPNHKRIHEPIRHTQGRQGHNKSKPLILFHIDVAFVNDKGRIRLELDDRSNSTVSSILIVNTEITYTSIDLIVILRG